MNEDVIMESLSARIRLTGYQMAADLYENWDEYISELDKSMYSDEEWEVISFKNEDGSPSRDVILDQLETKINFAKAHQFSENIIGDDASEDEVDYYDKLTDIEVAELLEEGIELFLDEKYKCN